MAFFCARSSLALATRSSKESCLWPESEASVGAEAGAEAEAVGGAETGTEDEDETPDETGTLVAVAK